MTAASRARDLWRHTGGALVWPFLLVTVTGFLVLFRYSDNPSEANARMADWDAFTSYARSLHLWSSRALLAGSAVHLAWVWHARRAAGPYAASYAVGAVLFGLLAIAHYTGHVMRWGLDAGPLLDRERAVLPFPLRLDALQFPLHVALVGGIAIVLGLVHSGLVGRRAHVGTDRAYPGGWNRLHTGLGIGVVILVAAAAFAWPAGLHEEDVPWPFGPFESVTAWAAWPPAFAVSALAAFGLVLAQPRLAAWPRLARATRWALVALFAWSLLPRAWS